MHAIYQHFSELIEQPVIKCDVVLINAKTYMVEHKYLFSTRFISNFKLMICSICDILFAILVLRYHANDNVVDTNNIIKQSTGAWWGNNPITINRLFFFHRCRCGWCMQWMMCKMVKSGASEVSTECKHIHSKDFESQNQFLWIHFFKNWNGFICKMVLIMYFYVHPCFEGIAPIKEWNVCLEIRQNSKLYVKPHRKLYFYSF